MSREINLGIVAHVDAGKTTLTEWMLYRCGQLRAPGSVDAGSTQTDSLAIEKDRGISVQAASASMEWKDTGINLIDTPGHVDFIGEVERSLAALDAAVLIVSAAEGIQAQTEVLWDALRELKIPLIVFVNKADRAGVDLEALFAQLRSGFGVDLLPLNRVENAGDRQLRLIDLAAEEEDDFWEQALLCIADADDDIAERYLEGEEIPRKELCEKLPALVCERRVIPLIYGCAMQGMGVEMLLDAVCRYLVPPAGDADAPPSGVVYRVTHDASMGKAAHVRLFSGTLKNRGEVLLKRTGEMQKITQIRKFQGAKSFDAGILSAGGIAALYGLTDVRAGDVLGADDLLRECHLSTPLLTLQVIPQKEEDLTPLVEALRELSEEDPLLDAVFVREKREVHIRIAGKIQLEVVEALLKERYGLTVRFGDPSVIYKETPISSGYGYDAYTWPKPCWAIVKLLIEPLPRGSGFVWGGADVPNDRMFYRYQTHVEQSMPRCIEQGLRGWEVTDLRVSLVDGSHHTIHTHPMDFFVCTPMAFMNGLENCGTQLLEPMLFCRILGVPEESVGRIIGELIAMRGTFDSPVIHDGMASFEARVPMATSLDFPVRLATMTGGRAILRTRFDGYEPCPPGEGTDNPRRGLDPRDRSKWIMHAHRLL